MLIDTLQGITLPASSEYRRDCIIPEDKRSEEVEDRYDFSTLFYDAIYLPRKRAICLICPKPLNLEAVIRQGRFTAGSEVLKISFVWRFKRFTEVWLKCRETPKSLRFQHGNFEAQIAVSHQQSELFRGLNSAVLKSKDNDLHWIRDWADYHVRAHGLQGLIFFDNGSSRYEPADILQTLRGVPGLRHAQVMSAPYRFGVRSHSDSMFLQVGLLNIARMRFCSAAAAVLSTDLDELVKPIPQSTIFAETRRSPLGYLLFRGRWRHLNPMGGETVRHSGHVYRAQNDLCRATKYCINPRGPVGFSHWDVHGAIRGFLKDYLTTDKYQYWHCRQLSTSWNFDRSGAIADPLEFDAETARLLGEVFPAESVAAA